MKVCSGCKEAKPFEAFSKSKARKDGYNGWCKVCHKAAKADWKERNREYYLWDARNYASKYRAQNPEKVSEAYSKWAKNNRPYLNERDRRRNANKKKATPSWANIETMRRFYVEAEKQTRITGIEHQVDHIVPLTSDRVCGLHVECNLQILTKPENGSKGNHWWPDMWDE